VRRGAATRVDPGPIVDRGLLSSRPAPEDATSASGRYAVVGGRVMFIGADVDHETALLRSGLRPAPDLVVGYYSADRVAPGDPWRFVSIDCRRLRGSRLVPGEGVVDATRAAFADSGFGDVSRSIRRR
jgi:hypothetical protein